MKKDMFNGKVKKEYFSYIMISLIFIALLLFTVGGIALGAGIIYAASFMWIIGVFFVALGISYVVGCMLVIRKFPKYEKLRRILYNSDCYFTSSTSREYYGLRHGIRGRRAKIAFDLVTIVADTEERMGENKPIQYKIYSALMAFMGILGLSILFAVPLLFEKGLIFSGMSDGDFTVFYLLALFICLVLAIFFLLKAIKVGQMAEFSKFEWRFELYTSLVDIAVRKNNKKLKYWYKADQIKEIEELVRAAHQNAELKLEREGDEPVSFQVIDTSDERVVFRGRFI